MFAKTVPNEKLLTICHTRVPFLSPPVEIGVFVWPFNDYVISLHKISCTRQFVSKLPLPSFALSLQNIVKPIYKPLIT